MTTTVPVEVVGARSAYQVAYSFVSVEIPRSGRPLLVNLEQQGPRQPDHRIPVGEDPDDPVPPADLLVQALLALVGRPEAPAIPLGQNTTTPPTCLQMATAIIDRLAHHGHLLLFDGESYPMTPALMKER